MIGGGIGAVRDRAEIVGAGNHALGEQEPGGQLAIRARRPHDHREWLAVQPDFERLFGGGDIRLSHARQAAHPHDVDRPQRLGHGVILPL